MTYLGDRVDTQFGPNPTGERPDAAPVAWRYKYKGQTEVGWFFTGLLSQDITEEKWDIEPLYTHPNAD